MSFVNGFLGKWGNVPIDGNVRPFSALQPNQNDLPRNNKKHHFISVVYMNGFSDKTGRTWAYRSNDVQNPHLSNPRAVGYENYYYSQELPDGRQENHRFEDLWNTIETVWPETLNALRAKRLSTAISFNLLGMATIMRARVPAARDRHALLLEAKLRTETKAMEHILGSFLLNSSDTRGSSTQYRLE